jgi:NodT family efflux transporter outer membrane factor (OMF) lipoprotein
MHPLKKLLHISIQYTAVFVFLIPSGCMTVGPDYVKPEITTSPAWHAPLTNGLNGKALQTTQLAKWWATLGDKELTSLVERSLDNNLDVKQALSRIRQARAQRSIEKAGLFPSVDASASATRSSAGGSTGDSGISTRYSAGFDALWEIDLFGGTRRSIQAADADLQASIEDLNDVRVSLTAEVATNYFELRTYQSRLRVAEANLKNQEYTYRLTSERYQAGLVDELDMQQAKTSLENTRAGIPSLRVSIEESKNRLAVLLGVQPGKLHRELEDWKPLPQAPDDIAVGVPADTLRQRPDIRKAEQELIAQTARVGVATADLYPKLKLNGTLGWEAANTGSLFSSGSRSYSYGPGVSWPLFDAGAIRQNIEVSSAKQEQALQSYESAVLSALEEVENRLVAYSEEQNRRDALTEGARASQAAFDLARIKYESGLTDFSTLLDAQRSLLTLQEELAASNGKVITNLVSLYKALGGGWSTQDQAVKTDGQPSGRPAPQTDND